MTDGEPASGRGDEDTSWLLELPDHLDTSPLCPRHPRNQRTQGNGSCPMHGSNEMPAEGRTLQGDAAVPKGLEKDLAFDFGPPNHHAGSKMCPAHAIYGPNGVCVWHGRGGYEASPGARL